MLSQESIITNVLISSVLPRDELSMEELQWSVWCLIKITCAKLLLFAYFKVLQVLLMEEEVRQEIEPKNSLTFLPHFSGSSVIMLISKEKILTHILTSIIFQSFFFGGWELLNCFSWYSSLWLPGRPYVVPCHRWLFLLNTHKHLDLSFEMPSPWLIKKSFILKNNLILYIYFSHQFLF